MSEEQKVVVIGIDGATFDVVRPLVAQGRLPTLARLMREGSHGTLTSCLPDMSPPAWTSIATGKHPGKHGIFDFYGHRVPDYDLAYFNATYRTAEPVWSRLSAAGRRTCVVNIPMTYPPDEVNGIMISGMDTPDTESDFIHPPEVRAELDRAIGGYRVERGRRSVRGAKIRPFVRNLFETTENRFAAARYLMDKEAWDLFFIVFEATDRAQHQLWRFMDAAHPRHAEASAGGYGDVIEQVYADIDARLGALLERLPPQATLMVISDHGFGPLHYGVRLTRWLESEGYLVRATHHREEAQTRLAHAGRRLLRGRLRALAKRLVGRNKRKRGALRLHAALDLARTRAYPVGGSGSVYISLRGRQPFGVVEAGEGYESLRAEIIGKLEALRNPLNGDRVVEAAERREDVYNTFPDHAPDILVRWAPGYGYMGEREAAANEGSGDPVFVHHAWSGGHRPNGVLILHGAGVRAGHDVVGASVVDVAPTILAALGEPVPSDMDGKVLAECFESDSSTANASTVAAMQEGPASVGKPGGGYSDEDQEKVEQRLRDLGYVE